MAIPFLVAGGLAVAKGVFDAYGQEQQRKAHKRGLQGQLGALENLANITPSERQYVSRRRQIIAKGDPLIKEQFGRQIGTIRQQGQFMRQRAQGQAIQQGLEGSIVAQELRRKVDKDVLDSVQVQAQQMAMANAQAKRQAEGEIESMNISTDARMQQVKYQQALKQGEIDAVPGYDKWGTLANIAMQGVGVGVGAYYEAQDTKAAAETAKTQWEREMALKYPGWVPI